MDWNKLESEVERILSEALTLATANPDAGAVWAKRLTHRGEDSECRRRLGAISVRSAAWTRAAAVYLAEIPQKACAADGCPFIRANAATLRGDPETWAIAGYILDEGGRDKEALEWFSDWRSRAGLKPWMLWNYALALSKHGRDAEAYEVTRAALGLPPDHSSDELRVLIALYDALAGNPEKAAEHLRPVRVSELRVWVRFVYDTTANVIYAARSAKSGLKFLWELADLRRKNPFFWKDPTLLRFHKRATVTIAGSGNHLLLRAWARLLVRGLRWKSASIRARDTGLWKHWRVWLGY